MFYFVDGDNSLSCSVMYLFTQRVTAYFRDLFSDQPTENTFKVVVAAAVVVCVWCVCVHACV